MSNKEFSNAFDTLLNSFSLSVSGNKTIPSLVLDEYEKSIFLSQAQEELILGIYSGRASIYGSFESTEENRRYLSSLIKESSVDINSEESEKESEEEVEKENNIRPYAEIKNSSIDIYLPEDLWFITYEEAHKTISECDKKYLYNIHPVTQDEYHVIKNNPFRGANKRRLLRLDLGNNKVRIIGDNGITNYYVKYLCKPTPIVLINLPDGLSINSISTKTECTLHTALHGKILDLAVQLAIQSKTYNTSNDK